MLSCYASNLRYLDLDAIAYYEILFDKILIKILFGYSSGSNIS